MIQPTPAAITFVDVRERDVDIEVFLDDDPKGRFENSAVQHDSIVVLPDPGAPENTIVRRARTHARMNTAVSGPRVPGCSCERRPRVSGIAGPDTQYLLPRSTSDSVRRSLQVLLVVVNYHAS